MSEHRNSLWRACYAAAFAAQLEALYEEAVRTGRPVARADIADPNEMGTSIAEHACFTADAMVASLRKWDKENK